MDRTGALSLIAAAKTRSTTPEHQVPGWGKGISRDRNVLGKLMKN